MKRNTKILLLAIVFSGVFACSALSGSAYAASDISVSTSGTVSFGKVLASASGSIGPPLFTVPTTATACTSIRQAFIPRTTTARAAGTPCAA